MEVWDAYTADGQRAGQTLYRGIRIPDGLYHMVCEVLLRHTDGDYLCMRRAAGKPIYPGRWEATAGGSALKGESPLDCIRRELKEETGLTGTHFQLIGQSVWAANKCIYYTYLCEYDGPKDAVTLQKGETEGYRWMSQDEFADFVRTGRMIPNQKKRYNAFLHAQNIL